MLAMEILSAGARTAGGDAAEGIGNNVGFSSFVMEAGAEFFKQNAPTEDALSSAIGHLASKILVISMNVDLGSKQDVAKLTKCFDNT